MARFMGTVKGRRGPVHRLGSAPSGLVVTADGWNVGVRVEARAVKPGDLDEFTIYLTSGSNGGGNDVRLGVVRESRKGAGSWLPSLNF